MYCNGEPDRIGSKPFVLIVLCLSIVVATGLASTTTYFGFATPENKTLMQPQGTQSMSNNTNATNIVLVHGGWADGSGWSKQIPILNDAGHKVVAVLNEVI
jgi:pimeloyl-ACP methyl ester carboxylesterase